MNSYRIYRNTYNNLILLAKSNFYRKMLLISAHDMKKTWIILREIIYKTKQKSSLPTKLNVFQENSFLLKLEDPTLIAEHFNSYFASFGERISSSIDSSNTTNPLEFMKTIDIKDSFFCSPQILKKCMKHA